MSFDLFVVFAEMRTGSNFLELNLNAIDGLACHGEAFNPHFVGFPNCDALLGITREQRDEDPMSLLDAVRNAPGLSGFRFFHDHEPRILDTLLDNPRCAKIILTRNPLDSYVSWKIAQETGQWKLTNLKRRKAAQVHFDATEFALHLAALQTFQITLLNRLQVSGQTAFYVDYEDLQSVEIMNGLARWLGVAGRLRALDDRLKRQNPGSVTEKVENPEEMAEALAGLDMFNLSRTPNFEPRRPPVAPSYVAAARSPLLYMPVQGGLDQAVEAWLAGIDRAEPAELRRGFARNALVDWQASRPGHRSFTVLRHPAARAHSVFCEKILAPDGFRRLREMMRRQFGLPIPRGAPGSSYTRADHRAAFEAFLRFLKANLAGQTGIRVDARWCSQVAALRGFAELVPPDQLLREDHLGEDLPRLAARVGGDPAAVWTPPEPDKPYGLADIHDADLEALVRETYPEDYVALGFGPWRGQAA